jgi:hypothetical protein
MRRQWQIGVAGMLAGARPGGFAMANDVQTDLRGFRYAHVMTVTYAAFAAIAASSGFSIAAV